MCVEIFADAFYSAEIKESLCENILWRFAGFAVPTCHFINSGKNKWLRPDGMYSPPVVSAGHAHPALEGARSPRQHDQQWCHHLLHHSRSPHPPHSITSCSRPGKLYTVLSCCPISATSRQRMWSIGVLFSVPVHSTHSLSFSNERRQALKVDAVRFYIFLNDFSSFKWLTLRHSYFWLNHKSF